MLESTAMQPLENDLLNQRSVSSPTLQSAESSYTVVITGCSSGIGFQCAVDLASRGWRVLAAVRRTEDGDKLVATAGHRVLPLLLDVTDPTSIANAAQVVQAELGNARLEALVNNAGILLAGPLESISMQQLREQFEVNVFGVHAVTRAMLPFLKREAAPRSVGGRSRRKHTARLVMMGSISGRITPPLYGAYAASKHALEAMADAWRMELCEQNIDVSIVQPDSVATPIWHKATETLADNDHSRSRQQSGVEERASPLSLQLRTVRRSGLSNAKSGMPPAHVVAAVRHALTTSHPRAHYPVGWRTRASFIAQQWLPTRLFDAVLRRTIGS